MLLILTFIQIIQVRTVDVYDPTADSWSSIASMEARRRWIREFCMDGNGEGCHPHYKYFDQYTWSSSVERPYLCCGRFRWELRSEYCGGNGRTWWLRWWGKANNWKLSQSLQPFKGFGHVGRWNPRVEKHREYEHKAQQCWGWSSPGETCTEAFCQYTLWNYSIVRKDSERVNS